MDADPFFRALHAAGLPEVPGEFSVALAHQEIARETLDGIDHFIRVFERVTTRPAWQRAATAGAPEIARPPHAEVCFFSAWDFHLPAGPEGFQLIEFNDNGSGFLFATLINRIFFERSGLDRAGIAPPPALADLARALSGMVAREAAGAAPGIVFILEDEEPLQSGKLRRELFLLRDLLAGEGWNAAVGAPAELRWDGERLLRGAEEVSFIVNRSTDFFWEAEPFASLRAATLSGRVRVVPSPFTYATRSDKRLLEPLSVPDRDGDLGVTPDERAVLSAHVPETRVLREDNVEDLARRKGELFFKPTHGFASHGLLHGAEVGRSRLRRLLARGVGYVAQRSVPKPCLEAPGGVTLWTDLRVWAYRGERFLLSGRASRRPDAVDLAPPGGWLPTYARA